MQIIKEEKYNVYKLGNADFTAEQASQMEKSVAVAYSGTGTINFICDISTVTKVSAESVKLFEKIVRISTKEGGLFVLVSSNDDLLDHISNTAEEYIIMLPTIEEAIDAVYMNEQENDSKDDDDEFEGGSESDY